MKTLLAIDFDPHACEVYRANFPGVDVRCLRVEDAIATMPSADVIIGGPPCQSFSMAGKGLGEADPRNGWPAYVASVRKVRPRLFLAENVAGMLTARHLKYLSRVYAELEGLGYRVEWRRFDSVNFGVPQFRDRIWVFGIRNDIDAKHQWPKPTHAWPWPKSGGMFGGDLLPAVTVGIALGIPHLQCDGSWFAGNGHSASIIGGERKGGRNHEMPLRDMTAEPAQTVGTHITRNGFPRVMGGGSNPKFPGDAQVERNITGEPSTTLAVDAGNAMPAIHYDHGTANPDAPCPTIKAGANVDASGHQGGACPPAIPYRWSAAMLAKHPPASPASPIMAKFYKGGAEGLLQVITNNPKHAPHAPANTLNSGGDGHGPTFANQHVQITHIDTKQHRTSTPVSTPVSTLGSDSRHVAKSNGLTVRRLTVEECQRLMSCPDDFQWPAGLAKTHKYRVLGNGQASLMAHHMAEALRRTDPASETVISLFCGGGIGDSGFDGKFWEYKP